MNDKLSRELGVFGATMLGLGSIIGTGVFVSIGVAAGVAGPAVIVAIILAALLAACNALSSAQLAAAYPVSGGTYEYGYRLLHPYLGFTAGWMFVCAKSASAAAAALGAAGYALTLLNLDVAASLQAVAVSITALFTLLVLWGLRQSSAMNIFIVSVTLLALVSFIVAGILRFPETGLGHYSPFLPVNRENAVSALLHASALMFVAFTGYGRIATLGEEVRDPSHNIPRAIVTTLIVSSLLYVLVAVAAIGAVGSGPLADAVSRGAAPLIDAAGSFGFPHLVTLLSIGAVTAMLGVLLNLILGLSRVVLAMGRRRDMPHVFAGINASGSPGAAVLAVGAVIGLIAFAGNIAVAWSFSAFTVLIYYALTNLSALRLPPDQRRYPRFVAWAGLAGCLLLAFFLPVGIWLPGTGLVLLGIAWKTCADLIYRRNQDKRTQA